MHDYNLFFSTDFPKNGFFHGLGNFFMQPALYLWRGKTIMQLELKTNHIYIVESSEKNWQSPTTWLTTAAAVVLLIPTAIIGGALKGIAYILSPTVQKHYRNLRLHFEYTQWKNSLSDVTASQPDCTMIFRTENEKTLFLLQLMVDLDNDPTLCENKSVQKVLENLLPSFPFTRESDKGYHLQRNILFFIMANPEYQTFFIEALAKDPLSGAEKITSFFRYPLSAESKTGHNYFSLVSKIVNEGYEALSKQQKILFAQAKIDLKNPEKQVFAIASLVKDSNDQKALKMIHNELLLLYLEPSKSSDFPFQIAVQLAVENAVYFENNKDKAETPHQINLTSKQMAQLIEEGPIFYSPSMLEIRPSLSPLIKNLTKHPDVLEKILEEPVLSPLSTWQVIGFLKPTLIERFKTLLKEKISTSFDTIANFFSNDNSFSSNQHRDLKAKDLQESHFDLLYEVITEENIQALQSRNTAESKRIISRLLQYLPEDRKVVERFISYLDENTITQCFYGTPMHVLPHLLKRLSSKEGDSVSTKKGLQAVFQRIAQFDYKIEGRFRGFFSSYTHLELLLPFLKNPSQSWKVTYLWEAFANQAIKNWVNPSGHHYPEEKLTSVHSLKTFLEWRRMRRDAPRGKAFQADDWLVSQLETSKQRHICDQILFNLKSYHSMLFKILTYFELAKQIFNNLSLEDRELLFAFRDEVLAELESTKDTQNLPTLLDLEGLTEKDQRRIIENLSQLPCPSLKSRCLSLVAANSEVDLDLLPQELKEQVLERREGNK